MLKRDPLNTWFDSLPKETKRKIELMLQHQEVALLHVFLTALMTIQEAYREGWDDLDEHIESWIETCEANLPKRYRRKPKTAKIFNFPTHNEGKNSKLYPSRFCQPAPLSGLRYLMKLPGIFLHNRGGRFEANADTTTVINKLALRCNPPDNILGSQYGCGAALTFLLHRCRAL